MSNLVTRTISGIVFAIVIVASIVCSAISFVVLFAAISAVCVWEFCSLVNRQKGLQINRMISTVAAVYLFLAVMAFNTEAVGAMIFVPYILTTVYLLISELYLHRKNPLENWAFAFASQLYIALPVALINVLAFRVNPFYGSISYEYAYPLAVMVFLWTNDMGAYCVGSTLQKYFRAKLFPSISPHKSWIGSFGGALLTIAASLVFAHFFPAMPLPRWIGMALVVVVFGTWGDLVESQIKRTLGVKDSGNFLPGHGGALDRFDSSLLAIPCVVLYFYTLEMM